MFSLNKNSFRDDFSEFETEIIGYYSVDRQKVFKNQDSSELRYYFPQHEKFNLDLNETNGGIPNVQFNRNRKINHILGWIIGNYEKIRADSGSEERIKPDFVISRLILMNVMKSLYFYRDTWKIKAVNYKGTIYVCPHKTESDENQQAELEKKAIFVKSEVWGLKFEQYILTDDPKNLPNTSEPVYPNGSFSCLFQTHLGGNSILYQAVINGVYSDEKFTEPLPLEKLRFLGLKTSASVDDPSKMKRNKFLPWWCKNYLAGVEDIHCGVRDDNGIVKEIKNYKVSNLPKMSEGNWSAGKCVNVLEEFFQFMKDNVKDDFDKTIYVFEKIDDKIRMSEVPATDSELGFLPEWYTQQ